MQAFQIHKSDNIAVLLEDIPEGTTIEVRTGDGSVFELLVKNAVRAGHKVSVAEIANGEPLLKYGFVIGESTRPIAAGEWVHLHNCRSRFDAISSELSLDTGARNETKYE